MSRIISGWVVSRPNRPGALRWQAWKSGQLRLVSDTYRGLLKLIRDANEERS